MQNDYPANRPSRSASSIPAIILAGGQSQRLKLQGLQKWQLPFHGNKTLLQYIVDKAKKQSNEVIINGPYTELETSAQVIQTDDLSQYAVPLIRDCLPGFQGPLAGLLTSLQWAKDNQHTWIMTLACDTPFFPDDLLCKLFKTVQRSDEDNDTISSTISSTVSSNFSPDNGLPRKLAVTVSSQGRMHPIFGLWSTALLNTLRGVLEESGNKKRQRSITYWAQQHAEVININSHCDNNPHYDPFFNINTLDDYQTALAMAKTL